MRAKGPRYGRARSFTLPTRVDAPHWMGGGIAIAATGELVVSLGGVLSWVDVAVGVRTSWRAPESTRGELDDDPIGEESEAGRSHVRRRTIGPPLTLDDGTVVIGCCDDVLVLDAEGRERARWSIDGLDDSNVSPNLTHAGSLVLGSMFGTVTVIDHEGPRALRALGYDVLPPAITRDDTLVLAGYAGAGLCAVSIDGTKRWSSGHRDADLLVTLDDDGFAACGSRNDAGAFVVSPEGSVTARIDGACTFASLPGGDWIARSEQSVRRVGRDGTVLWSHRIESKGPRWSSEVVISEDGRVHLVARDRVCALDVASGREVASIDLPKRDDTHHVGGVLSCAGPGLLGTLVGDQLVIVD
ncbi:MAG: hypothetical protein J0L92_28650 [Deltaproteobacteria bacterium]|nr:hypothetical protein [Deltaproteobacteria bacterium]